MEQENWLEARKIIPTILEKNCSWSKKNSSRSKILKYLVDAPCSTRTIRKNLNNKNQTKEKNSSSKVNCEAQRETTGICSSISNHEC